MDNYDDERLLEERKQKQMYLKSEIIEKNYDGGQFAEFLSTKRDEGTSFSFPQTLNTFLGGSNIDMWSFIELKKVLIFL